MQAIAAETLPSTIAHGRAQVAQTDLNSPTTKPACTLGRAQIAVTDLNSPVLTSALVDVKNSVYSRTTSLLLDLGAAVTCTYSLLFAVLPACTHALMLACVATWIVRAECSYGGGNHSSDLRLQLSVRCAIQAVWACAHAGFAARICVYFDQCFAYFSLLLQHTMGA